MDGLTVLKRFGRMKWIHYPKNWDQLVLNWLRLTAVTRGHFLSYLLVHKWMGLLTCHAYTLRSTCFAIRYATVLISIHTHAYIHACMHALRCVALHCILHYIHDMTWHDINYIILCTWPIHANEFAGQKFSNIRDDVTCVHVICLVYKYLIGACVCV